MKTKATPTTSQFPTRKIKIDTPRYDLSDITLDQGASWLDPRLPFPDSVGGICPGPPTTQNVFQGIELLPSWRGYTMIDSFEHVD